MATNTDNGLMTDSSMQKARRLSVSRNKPRVNPIVKWSMIVFAIFVLGWVSARMWFGW
jgi:hypothetical protein